MNHISIQPQVNSNYFNKRNKPHNQPNFNGITLVQVKNSAFDNPENVLECANLFMNKFNLEMFIQKTKNLGFFKSLKLLFKRADAYVYPETPSYIGAKNSMEKLNLPYSIEWFAQNTGIPVKKALDPNYHSFFVYTGEDRKVIAELFKSFHKKEHINAIKAEAEKKFPFKKAENSWLSAADSLKAIYESSKEVANQRLRYAMAKLGAELDKVIENYHSKCKINNIKIESLDEIPSLVTSINI